MAIRASKQLALLLSALSTTSLLAVTGCGSQASGTGASEQTANEIGLELNVAGVSLNSASFTITGPANFTKAGTIDLTNSATLSAVIGGIPAGSGFSIAISAASPDASTTCAGSASFNVVAHSTTTVTVNLTCHQASRTGSVAINGTLNVCPVIDEVSANPSDALLGSSLALAVNAHDVDGAPAALTYHWTATSGSFSDANAAKPTFTCLTPGSVTITAFASDGDPAASCADSSSVTIHCGIPVLGGTDASTIAVYGDAPYGTTPTDTAEFVASPAFISSVNADPNVNLVLHVGDIHSGKQFCTEAYDRSIFDLWKGFQDPLVYTPGDNEWSDCHKVGEGGGAYSAATGQIKYVLGSNGLPADYASGDPLANLALVRSIFFASPGSTLGTNSKRVLSQAQFSDPAHPGDAKFVENVMFEQSKVLFVVLNTPGGSNNDNDVWYLAPTQTAEQTQEVAERTGATTRWLDLAFAQAQADGVAAVLIQTQADMWDPASNQAGYEPIVQSIASHTSAFAKPVILFNGDSHVYRSDNPLSATDPLHSIHPAYDVQNFHRIVVHGSTLPLEWLRVTISPAVNAPASANAFGPFSWQEVIP